MIDLHMHTTYSDGYHTIEEVLQMAEEKGLKIISITDHDTTIAYDDLEDEEIRNIFSGQIIKGLEITTFYKNYRIELLAYDFDNYELIDKYFEDFNKDISWEEIYIKERTKLLKKLDDLNLKYDDIFKQYIGIERYETNLYKSLVKHNKNLKEILKEDYVENPRLFFRKSVSNPDSQFFCEFHKYYPNIKDVIKLIKDNNGITLMAHPFSYGINNIKPYLNDLYDNNNIDGIETYYYDYNEEQVNYLKEFAKKRNLLTSGGSDFHGLENRPNLIGQTPIMDDLELLNKIRKPI